MIELLTFLFLGPIRNSGIQLHKYFIPCSTNVGAITLIVAKMCKIQKCLILYILT